VEGVEEVPRGPVWGR